jgi:hypothetical protein
MASTRAFVIIFTLLLTPGSCVSNSLAVTTTAVANHQTTQAATKLESTECYAQVNGVCCPAGNACEQAGMSCETSRCTHTVGPAVANQTRAAKSKSSGCCAQVNGVCCPADNACEQAGMSCETSCCKHTASAVVLSHQPSLGKTHRDKSNNTGNLGDCDSYYTMYGGCRDEYRGQYNQMPVSHSCNGRPIYQQGSYYLYNVGNLWIVSTKQYADSCQQNMYIYCQDNTAACPNACAGKWVANTGDGNTGNCDTTFYNNGAWCPSTLWWV